MKKKSLLSVVLALCIAVSGLLISVSAEAHNHDGWTAAKMDGSSIKVGGTAVSNNTLSALGSYYLNSDITVPIKVSAAVTLCFNGHSITVSTSHAVHVKDTGSLTVCGCSASEIGRIGYTSSASYRRAVYVGNASVL